MKKIGLTGGIGCGKTTVLNEFQKLGIPCFNADGCAGAYYDDTEFCSNIASLFGSHLLTSDGHIDKSRLAQQVFSNRNDLTRLNSIIHPRVMNDFSKWAEKQDSPYVIFESAIIYEYSLDKYFDKVIAIYLDKEERLRRLTLRDHTTRQQLESRMRNQLTAEETMLMADYVILNYEGNPRQRQVMHIHNLICG